MTSASGSVTLLHNVRSCEHSITSSCPPGLSLSYVGVNFKRALIRFRFSYGNADLNRPILCRFMSSPLPPKPAKQPAMDVALGEGGALLGVQVGTVVLVGGLGAGEGACPGELPDAGWHLPDEAHLDGGQQ